MDSLRLGMLLPGGRPVGDGINRAQRAPAQIYASYTDDLLLAAERIIATADILNAALPLNQGLHFLRRRWLALHSMTALRIRTTQGDLDYGH